MENEKDTSSDQSRQDSELYVIFKTPTRGNNKLSDKPPPCSEVNWQKGTKEDPETKIF